MPLDGRAAIEGVAEKFMSFLSSYSPAGYEAPPAEEDEAPAAYIARTVAEMASENETVLYVDWKHLLDYDYELADTIMRHYERAEAVLREVLKAYIRQHHEQYIRDAHGPEKEFFVGLFGLNALERLRDLRTEHIGQLAAFSGTVTRTSDVRPELFLGTFKCQVCGCCVKNVEQFYKYTEPLICPEPSCNNRCGAHAWCRADGHARSGGS